MKTCIVQLQIVNTLLSDYMKYAFRLVAKTKSRAHRNCVCKENKQCFPASALISMLA